MIGQRSYVAKPATISRSWYLVDASNKTLGRLATELALRLRGKHKPEFTPGADCGDFIVVINSDKIHTTGNKLRDKKYYRYTGYVGNLKEASLEKMLEKDSTKVIQLAVKGMLPRGPLGRAQLGNLKIYAGSEHPHSAQEPTELNLS